MTSYRDFDQSLSAADAFSYGFLFGMKACGDFIEESFHALNKMMQDEPTKALPRSSKIIVGALSKFLFKNKETHHSPYGNFARTFLPRFEKAIDPVGNSFSSDHAYRVGEELGFFFGYRMVSLLLIRVCSTNFECVTEVEREVLQATLTAQIVAVLTPLLTKGRQVPGISKEHEDLVNRAVGWDQFKDLFGSQG